MTVLLGQSILGGTGTDFELSGVQIGSFWICTQDGIIDSVTVRTDTGTTATSLEVAIFADNGTNPTTQIGNVSTTPLSNGVVNRQTTGGMEARVYRGQKYWIIFCVLGGGQFQFRTFNGNGGSGGTAAGTKDGPTGGGLMHIQTPFSLQSTFAEVIWCFADGQALDRKQYLPRKVGPRAGPSFFAGLPKPPVVADAGAVTTPQDLTATVTSTATITRQIGKPLSATATTTATLVRQVGKAVTATVTSTASMVRQVGKPLTATVTTIASLLAQKVILKALTATVTSTATITRQIGKPLSVTVTSTALMVKRVGKPLSATVTSTASQVAQKVILKALTATVTTTATIARQIGKPLGATATVTASVVKQVGKPLTATVTSTATITALKVFLRTLTATVTSTAAITRQVGKPLGATVTSTATLVKQVGKRLTATATSTATLLAQRVFLRTLTATVTTTATMTRRTGKAMAAAVTATGSFAKRIAKTISAGVQAVASLIAETAGGQPIGHIDGAAASSGVDDMSVVTFIADGNSSATAVESDLRVQLDEGESTMTGRID
jgi:hypothetical protein